MDSIVTGLPRVRRGRSVLRGEFLAMLGLALPLALTQLGLILINGTEVLLLGRLGAGPLASITLAWLLFFAGFVFAMGVAQATAPLIGVARGAGRPAEVRRAVQAGLWVAALVTLPICVAVWHGRPILRALGQDDALLVGTEVYLRAIVFGLPFSTAFVVLRNFVSAFDRAVPVTAIVYFTMVVNVPLSAGLIFGWGPLPRLEILGAGIGAAVSWAQMFLLLLGSCLVAPTFRPMRVLAGIGRPAVPMLREILRIGLPIGAAMLLETSMFAAAGLMMGRLGADALAAHQVTLQLAATTFMIPFGISIASTIRIGIAMGAGSPAGVRRAGWVAVALGGGFMAAMGLAFFLFGAGLTALFFDPAAGGAAPATAARLIQVAALFQLVDGLQVIGIANLRGMKDTAVPMWLAGFGYWLVGVPVSALLGFTVGLGPVGIWGGLATGLAVVAAMMVLRFRRLTAPGRLERRLERRLAAPVFCCLLLAVPASLARAAEFLPFFDAVDRGPGDPAPPPPLLGPFDRALLGLCGEWGSRPRASAFRALLDRAELQPAVAPILAALDPPADGGDARERLTRLWFARGGFRHVFCGEPGSSRVGGLHYVGRFLDLQERGVAGLAPPGECRAQLVRPPIYTIGIDYRLPDGGIGRDCPTGYARDLDAPALMLAATRAATALLRRGAGKMCLAEILADGPAGVGEGARFTAVVAAAGDGIVTFYPDSTPACPGRRPPSTCACPAS